MESPIQPINAQPINKIEKIEKEPKVEHLFFGDGKRVLIKTSFPWREGTAYSYIYISEPTPKTYEEVKQESYAFGGEEMNETEEKHFKRGFDFANKPIVFKGKEDAQEWFNMTDFKNSDERRSVASFLGLEDKGL